MIHAAIPARKSPPWRRELAASVRDPAELLALLDLPATLLDGARRGARTFALRVPRDFVRRMRRGDPDDPLLRQVLPLQAELHEAAGFVPDPVGDLDSTPLPGVLHKYRGRALLITSPACAVNCRYCFRRQFPYADALAARDDWDAAIGYLESHRDITEVILSGGDPLTLPDSRLSALAARLDALPHLQTLRLHTRLPVVLPSRVDAALCGWLGGLRMRTVVVIHANHAQELDEVVAAALRRLSATGATLLNQTVLLAGVNDCADTQIALARRLFACGTLPYYLHQLDKVAGAAHFEVADSAAILIAARMSAALPGYLVPRLVREQPGADAKQPLWPASHSARAT